MSGAFERGRQFIVSVANELSIPPKAPYGDPMNMILNRYQFKAAPKRG